MAINLINGLYEEGDFLPYLIVSRHKGTGSAFVRPEIEHFLLGKKRFSDWRAFNKLIKYLKDQNIKILHAHSTSYFWGILAKLFVSDLKVVWHDHYGFRHLSSAKFNRMIKVLGKKLSGYIGVSNNLMDWAKANIRIADTRRILLANFPELSDPNAKMDAVLKGSPIFLLLGNYRAEKNHVWLVEVFREVLKQLPEATLLFVGKAIDADFKTKVLQRIDELGLQNKIFDLGESDNVATVIAHCDIGLFASKFEALPVSLLEFGLLGKPVISTNVGEIPNVLGNGIRGIVVPLDNIEIYVKEMVALGSDREKQNYLGRQLQQFVNANYSKASAIKKLNDFYTEILK